MQKEKILPLAEKRPFNVVWHNSFDNVGWQEVLIASSTDSRLSVSSNPTLNQSSSLPCLVRVLSPSQSAASNLLRLSSRRLCNLPVGSQVETSRRITKMLKRGDAAAGGCGLIIDYGDDKVFSDSLRVSAHPNFFMHLE
jgi:NADH dehydrogenase [ubiquinone] 1 alpha subcomplex assembly factor 7